jgi:hypothetical protein
MKSQPKILFFACLLLALGLSSCASSVDRRISRNPEAFAKLSAMDQTAVRAGRIREGMTKEAVLLSWGKPARISAGKRDGKSYERWNYVQYQSVVRPNYGMAGAWGWGGGWGGGWGCGLGCRGFDPFWGMGMGPTVDFVPYEAAMVEFTKNIVTGWSVPQ